MQAARRRTFTAQATAPPCERQGGRAATSATAGGASRACFGWIVLAIVCVGVFIFSGLPVATAQVGPDPVWREIACQATDMALDSRGVLYVLEADAVLAVLPEGEKAELRRGLMDPAGVAVDARRRVYVSSAAKGEVYRIEPNGGLRRVMYGLPSPGALAVDRDGGLYVALKAEGRVIKIPEKVLEQGLAQGGLAYFR